MIQPRKCMILLRLIFMYDALSLTYNFEEYSVLFPPASQPLYTRTFFCQIWLNERVLTCILRVCCIIFNVFSEKKSEFQKCESFLVNLTKHLFAFMRCFRYSIIFFIICLWFSIYFNSGWVERSWFWKCHVFVKFDKILFWNILNIKFLVN